MLSRQCELVHRRYTADQETVLTAAPLGLQGSRRFGAGFPKTPPHQAGLYGENSSRVRVGERERRPGWHLSIHPSPRSRTTLVQQTTPKRVKVGERKRNYR